MRQLKLALSQSPGNINEIHISEEDHETCAIIHCNDKGIEPIILELRNGKFVQDVIVTPEKIFRLNLQRITSVIISTETTKKFSISLTIYMGNWAEVMISDLNFNLHEHLQSCDISDKINFRIGNEEKTHLECFDNDELTFRIKVKNNQVTERSAVFFKGSKEAGLIKKLHKKISDNCKSTEFLLDQQKTAITLQKNTESLIDFYKLL